MNDPHSFDEILATPQGETSPIAEPTQPMQGTSASLLTPGVQLANRYRILGTLGEGGMGVVYEAFDTELERKVALKLIVTRDVATGTASSSLQLSAQARLIVEAQAQARLSHPNVVAVYDVGTSIYGVYMAMELVQGQTIKAWIKQRAHSWREVVAIFLQAIAGLAAAHAADLVHRDFKPENLLLGSDGRVRVADFGVATAVGKAQHYAASSTIHAGQSTTGAPSEIAGTPAYMAPEQHRGEQVTAKSDQYALCVSLYEALFGVRPFLATSSTTLLHALENQPLRFPRRIPRWLRTILSRGLAPHPADRFANLQEMQEALADGYSRRLLPTFITALVGCAGLAGTLVHLHHRNASEQLCHARASRAQDIWSPSTWQAVENAFLATGAAFAADAMATAHRVVQDRIANWQALYLTTCQAESDSPAGTATTYECLHAQLHELEMLATIYRQPNPRDLLAVSQTVTALPHADECLHQRASVDARDRPTDARLLADYLAIKHEFEASENAFKRMERGQAMQRMERLFEQGLRVGSAELLAPMASKAARFHTDAFETQAALIASNQAIAFAEAAHNPQMSANVLAEQLFLRGYKLGTDREVAPDLYRLSQAHLSRAGGDPVLAAHLCIQNVPFLSTSGQSLQSERCLRAAIDIFESHYGLHDSRTIQALEYMAVTIGFSRVDPEMEQLLLQVKNASLEVLGPRHPTMAMTYYNLDAFSRDIGDIVQAVKYIEEARAIMASGSVDGDLVVAAQLRLISHTLDQGALEQAQHLYRECLHLLEPAKDRASEGSRLTCTIGSAVLAARFGDYRQCGLAHELVQPVLGIHLNGYFREDMQCNALGSLRDLAEHCGDIKQADHLEALQRRCIIDFNQLIGRPKPVFEVSRADLRKAPAEVAILSDTLANQVEKADPNRMYALRLDTLHLRENLAMVLLQTNQAARASRLLENDAQLRRQLLGGDLTQYWRNDVWRAWARLSMGHADEARALLEPIAALLPASEEDLLHTAYLHAVLAHARTNDSFGHWLLARKLASRLRAVPAGLQALLAATPHTP